MAENSIKLWHCLNARSLRPLWALEEMQIEYDIEVLPFPPRFLKKEFLQLNSLGTVPFFVDGQTTMTESTGICHYLAERYAKDDFRIVPDHPEYGDFLNWLYHSDATLTFPQTIVLRYSRLEAEDRRQPQVVADYARWFIARLRRLDEHLAERQYLCDGRFTIADIAIGYALYLGRILRLDADYSTRVTSYLDRLVARPAFKRAAAIGAPDDTRQQEDECD